MNATRRQFLRLAGMGMGIPLQLALSAACSPALPAAAPTAVPVAPTAVATKLPLPSYIPIEAAKPELPATPAGLDAGYLSFPKNLIKSVAQTPGSGASVSVFTLVQGPPPPAVDANPAWQAVNKALNAQIQMVMAPRPDYPTKVATTMAGGDLPDLFTLYLLALSIGNIPDFLKASYADLTPYLAGDAVKAYPNLAAIPSVPWKQTVFNGGIYGVPIPRPYFQYVWYVNQSRMDQVGGAQPKNGDHLKQLLKELTRPDAGQWGMAQEPNTAFGLTLTPLLAMFKVPNNWRVDSQGVFTKDIETPEFKAALGYLRDLYASGVFDPDSPTLNSTTVKSSFVSGKAAVISTGWFSYAPEFWNVGIRQNPVTRFRTLHPFSSDGSTPVWHQYPAFVGMTAIKQGSPERIRELLRILDYVAAPFGSQEALLLEYGIENTDFTYDANGNPILNDRGQADTSVSWRYLTMRPQVLFNPMDSDFVKVAYADEQTMVPNMLVDPTLGLFSATNSSKGTVLFQKFVDGAAGIVAGRDPLSLLDQLLSDWRSGGGDQMRREFQQANAA